MTAPDPANEAFVSGLLASADDDVPPQGSLDRELARLGLASVVATAATVGASSAASGLGASTTATAGSGAATGGATAAGAGLGGAAITKAAGVAAITKAAGVTVLSTASAKVLLLAVVGAVSTTTWLVLREPATSPVPIAHPVGYHEARPSAIAAPVAAPTLAAATVATATTDAARAASTASTLPSFAAASPPPRVARAFPNVTAKANATAPSANPSPTEDRTAKRLGAEVALVDRARALAHYSPNDALAILDEHARTFPAAVLRDEATVVRVEALVTARRTTEAQQLASPYLRDRAGTPIARRMSTLLESSNVRIP